MIFEDILLEPEQKELLCKFVEAERLVPKGQRGKFIAVEELGRHDTEFIYTTASAITLSGSLVDAEILAEKGLLGLSYNHQGNAQFYITPEGHQYYRELKQSVQPAEVVEKEIRTHLSSDAFKNAYPVAFQKWSEAETLLWESDSNRQFTIIGHLCREALQEFADVLVRQHKPPHVDPDKAHTVTRLRSVLQARASSLGSTEMEFLNQLVRYWQSMSELVQRQEHGGQRESTPLIWEDARRVVFHTCIVMYEVDRSLSKRVP